MSDPLLEVRHLRKIYPTEAGDNVVAVQDVSFSIHHGETLGLVGASGSGKSTTARCILQLERPDAGSVHFDGVDLCALRGRQIRLQRRGMQVVFQDPLSSLDPRWTIRQTVEEPLRVLGMTSDEKSARVAESLRLVGLEEEYGRRPHELSGGQAQRAAIARAIAGFPQLLICDEATSALDVSIQAQILNLLREAQRTLNLALLFISHDLGVVRALCDRVLVMRAGLIVEEGYTSAVMSTPEAAYTQQLVEAASVGWE